MCGENKMKERCLDYELGSPPRVRGKLFLMQQAMIRTRITPACAGKTHAEFLEDFAGKDHPRVCGENSIFWMAF